MTLNCTWRRGFVSRDLKSVQYHFIAINVWFILTQAVSTDEALIMSHIDWF